MNAPVFTFSNDYTITMEAIDGGVYYQIYRVEMEYEDRCISIDASQYHARIENNRINMYLI